MVPDDASVEHAKTLIEMVYDGETIEEDDLKVPVEEQKKIKYQEMLNFTKKGCATPLFLI